MKKSPRPDHMQSAKVTLAPDDEDVAAFAGAVGFFDADTFTNKKRHDSIDHGAMGFFECLDNKAELALGVSQTNFTHDGNNDRVMEWTELVEVLSKSGSGIQRVVIRNNKLTSPDMQVLSGLLINFHQLQVIDLSGNPLGLRGVNTLLDCCRGHADLAELHLAEVGLGDVAEHDYDNICAIDDFPSLRVLDLSANNLSLDCIRVLMQSVSEHPRLERLALERNNVSFSAVGEFLRLLRVNTCLQTLLLSSTRSKAAAANPLRLLKRTARKKSANSFVEQLVANFSIRNLQVDGLGAQELAKLGMVMQQNETLWQQRNVSRPTRLVLSQRGVSYMHPIIFTLTHLVELDFSNNALEAVPAAITMLKSLVWLSLEKNDISGFAMPLHLVECKKIRHLNLLGNPLVADLPKDVPADNCPALMGCFRMYLSGGGEIYEPQLAVCFAGESSSELGKLSGEVERISKRSKLGLIRLNRVPLSTSWRGNFVGRFLAPDKAMRAPGITGSSRSRLSFRSAAAFEASASSVMLYGLLRDCDLSQLPIYALFYRLIVFSVDAAASDWEARARDAWSSFNPSKLPSVILVIANSVSIASTPDAKRDLIQSLLQRFKSFGVVEVVLLTGADTDWTNVHDAVSATLLNMIDLNSTVSRAHLAFLSSLMVPSSSFQHPQIAVSAFAKPDRTKLLQWAQASGILSSPIAGGVVCSNVSWAVSCLESLVDVESSVFGLSDIRSLFESEASSEEGRKLALHLLETSFAIVNTGWLNDQWIVQQGHQNTPLSARFVLQLAHPPAGASLLTRLYRIKSALMELSVAALIRRLFLQTAGVLSDISAVSDEGFSGSLLLGDLLYAVRLSVENNFFLTLAVDMHSDPTGQVVYMVTSAIERALEESRVLYERVYLNELKKEAKVENEIAELVKATERSQVTKFMSSVKMSLLPDLRLLGVSRLFWNELTIGGVIGKGSFGEVSLATINASKRRIAVKKIRTAKKNDDAPVDASEATALMLREILRELWVLSVLRHPNIVAAAGVCLDPLAVCMEYLDLSDLRLFLDKRGAEEFPWHVRHSLLMDIASGMNYAHGQRPPLVHSDLKSPNILLCSHNGTLVAKIADLGLASFSSLNTAAAVNNPLVKKTKRNEGQCVVC